MSNTELNKVAFWKLLSVPEMPDTEKYAEYLIYKNEYNGHWGEYFYDNGYDFHLGEDFIALKEQVGDDHNDSFYGLFFDSDLDEKVHDFLRFAKNEGFVFTEEPYISAFMIHYNGADDYLIDLKTFDDVLAARHKGSL